MKLVMTNEFEGALITAHEGRLPSIKVECPEAYKRGTILKLTMEVRVKSVRLEENRDGDLTRSHVFAVESVNVDEVYDPAEMIAQLSGSIETFIDPDAVVVPDLTDKGIAETSHLGAEMQVTVDLGETVVQDVKERLDDLLAEELNF